VKSIRSGLARAHAVVGQTLVDRSQPARHRQIQFQPRGVLSRWPSSSAAPLARSAPLRGATNHADLAPAAATGSKAQTHSGLRPAWSHRSPCWGRFGLIAIWPSAARIDFDLDSICRRCAGVSGAEHAAPNEYRV